MKRHRLSTRGLLIFLTCAFLGSVFALSALAVYLDNNGFGPEEDATAASVIFTTYLYGEECYNKLEVKAGGQQEIADLRSLEKKVKDLTLKEYTSMVLWEAEFTYIKEDGTQEQRTYRKTGVSKDVDKFLDKYYIPPAEGSGSG